MSVLSGIATAVLTAGLFVPLLWFTDKAEAQGPQLRDMEAIEATIAYKKTPIKQPQKQTTPQPTIDKPEGVSHDENKKPPEKKDEKKPDNAKVDPNNPFGKFTRPSDDDSKPTTQPGDFNGDEKGFADVSKGDPFIGRLNADVHRETFPDVAKSNIVPVGCIHLKPDGTIEKFTFDPPTGQRGDSDLQTYAEQALTTLVKLRHDNPEPVPTHLLGLTTKWLCFKFTVQQ